jgi:hypothetical protein
MSKHLTDGELRASLDGERETARLAHLKLCAECLARQRQLQIRIGRITHRLAFLVPNDELVSPARKAWSRFSESKLTYKEMSMFKKLFSFPIVRFGAIAALILALVLAFPQTRALADELLNLFRVQQVAVIPVDFTGMKQLTGNDALGKQISQLISSSIDMTQKPGDPTLATDAAQASKLAGFSVRLPDGKTPSQIYVTGAAAFTATIDREKAQALIDEAGRNDLVLPDTIDGAKISVKIPASANVGFGACPKPQADEKQGESDHPGSSGRRFPDCVMLAEIPSPTVQAPAGVDVAQLAQIGLEFTGMSREEAAAYTQTIDWASTLVVPIPKNAATYQQVSVDGVTGTLIQRPADDAPQFALLWVKNGIVYSISGLGSNSQQAIDMANSLH